MESTTRISQIPIDGLKTFRANFLNDASPTPRCLSFPWSQITYSHHTLATPVIRRNTRYSNPTYTTLQQAMDQFKKDASVLLKPFGNRIPAGVKGLDSVLTEYVAFKDADSKRKHAVASNPLAKRMYDVLEEVSAGVVPNPDDCLPVRTNETDVAALDGPATSPGNPVGISPYSKSPSNEQMPPPPARSPHRGKKRGGTVPRRNVGRTVSARDTEMNAVDGVTVGTNVHSAIINSASQNKTPPGSLDDETYERLAQIIVSHVPNGDEGMNGNGNLNGKDSTTEKQNLDSMGGLDVDAVMDSLFENDNDGTLGELLGPLLGGGFGQGLGSAGGCSGQLVSPSKSKGNTPSKSPNESNNKSPNIAGKKSKRKLELNKDECRYDGSRRVSGRKGDRHETTPLPAHVQSLDVEAFVKSIEY